MIMSSKKVQYVSVNVLASKSILLPGRHRCECQATKHDLVNNCLSCGRVVCAQEGKGPCFCCGELVLNRSERYRVLEGTSKKTQSMIERYSKLPRPVDDLGSEDVAAQAFKDRLLEYDRSSAQRTKVIDDQSDYFTSNSPWLSEEEKKVLKQKEDAYREMKDRLRRKVKVTIDFAGRKIVEESANTVNFEDLSLSSNEMKQAASVRKESRDVSERILDVEAPEFVGSLERKHASGQSKPPVLWSNRIQDSELQEVVDSGSCLSVQQPYATLIIDGIKIFEGRTWYTPFRGRLWICAAAKQPSEEVVKEVERAYKLLVENVQFPLNYPVSCLLGCVDVIDCIPQEEYLELYPNGEVSDPYVWVLANPRALPFRIPMQPKPKIFKLEMHIHQAAKRSLK